MPYNPDLIEPKWQRYWLEHKTFRAEIDPSKPKYYILDMFPYPSGSGLHVGHPKGYTATDVLARYRRMLGFNVLHPMGWDAFGLPAERAAVREGIHPAVITQRNTDIFRRQIQRLGFSYDWDREVNTSSPDYYRWTQWLFLKLYEKGLAYQAEVPVNWCPALGTVLANEEVQDGCYVETGDPVERRTMRQWMLRITAYAQRLIDDLDEVDWPQSVKDMQYHWIGRSEGAEAEFKVRETGDAFIIFTTRPDTLFGATYCVLSPEHPLVSKVTVAGRRSAVEEYVVSARQKTDRDRTAENREKTGVFTGAHAINPVNGKSIPIWVADYVLMTYGAGAIMAVPGHDERDHEFARRFDLPIVEVVKGGDVEKAAYVDNEGGELVGSDFLNGLKVPAAKERIIRWLEDKKVGRRKVQFKLRDWLFSRQRYWGEPFPILHLEDGTIKVLTAEDLPVLLPQINEYRPTADGKPPLARAKDWLTTIDRATGRKATRETNTMPQWAGSCWYYLRFIDPLNDREPWSKEAEKYWMPVDLYVGGVEHAVLHLLYSRFWHKVFFDAGLVSTKEPFKSLRNQGMILAYSFQDSRGRYFYPEDVVVEGERAFTSEGHVPLESRIEKMSKSKLNVVNPDDVIESHGADSMRLYECFMGPLEGDRPWQTSGVEGVRRFLDRVWRLFFQSAQNGAEEWLSKGIVSGHDDPELDRLLHKTIQKVTEDLEAMALNTAIAQMMTFVNAATGRDKLSKENLEKLVLLLAPFAPHIAEEIWHALGHDSTLAYEPWPRFDPILVRDDTIEIAVQVNGKLRDTIAVAVDASTEDLERAALASDKIKKQLAGALPRKVIVVPGKIVNIVS